MQWKNRKERRAKVDLKIENHCGPWSSYDDETSSINSPFFLSFFLTVYTIFENPLMRTADLFHPVSRAFSVIFARVVFADFVMAYILEKTFLYLSRKKKNKLFAISLIYMYSFLFFNRTDGKLYISNFFSRIKKNETIFSMRKKKLLKLIIIVKN